MNLNELAESDLEITLEDVENGFAVELIFLDAFMVETTIPCQTTDIGFFVDPGSDMGVSGRQVEINCRIKTLDDNNVIVAKDDVVMHKDTLGNTYKTRIKKIEPDRKLPIYKILLEASN